MLILLFHQTRGNNKKRRGDVSKPRHFSSSSEDLSSTEDKENNIQKGKVVPALPRKEDFTKKQLLDTREMTVDANTFMNTGSNNDANNVFTNNITRRVEHSAAETHNEHLDTCDFKKHIIWKLNKVLYKLENIENRLHILQEQRQSANEFCKTQEMNIYFLICTIPDLTSVEEKLKEENFQNDVLHFFKVVGRSTAYIMIRNIFKKTITDNVTKHFNWTGKKDKQSFKDLRLSKIIIQREAVRMTYKEMTDSDITDYISKWLAQANIRIQREKNEENSGK